MEHTFRQHHHQETTDKQTGKFNYQRGYSALTWWAALCFATIVGFSRLSYGLLLPAIRTTLPSSYGTYGLVATANFVGYLSGTLILPSLLTRFHQRLRFNSGALLAMNLAMIGAAISFSLLQLGIWRLLIGFFSAFATVLTVALTLEYVQPQERGKASGLIWMGAAFGVIISSVIAPFILGNTSSSGWRFAWIVMGIMGLVTTIGLHLTMRNIDAQRESNANTTRPASAPLTILLDLFRPRSLLFLTLSYFGYGFGYIIYLTFFVTLVVHQGLPALFVGLIWAVMGLGGAISGPIWQRTMDRWPNGFTLASILFLGALSALSVLTNSLIIEYAGAALFGLSLFVGPPLLVTVLLKRAVADERYASSYSFITAIFAIGQVIGPVLGGIVVDHISLTIGVATTTVVLGITALFAIGYGMVQRQPTPQQEVLQKDTAQVS